MRLNELRTHRKHDDSPVTEADIDSDRRINEILRRSALPVISEEGDEDRCNIRKGAERFWLVDPLDGTKEYVAGRDEYTINIALIIGEHPVLGVIAFPEKNLIYLGLQERGIAKVTEQEAERGDFEFFIPTFEPFDIPRTAVISRSHLHPETQLYLRKLRDDNPELNVIRAASAMKFCLLAEGKVDVYPRYAPCMIWDTAAGDAILRSVGRSIARIDDGAPLNYRDDSLINPPFIAK